MTLVSMEIEIDLDLMDDAGFVLAELGFSHERAIQMFLDKCVEVGGIPFDFDPEWLIDDSLPRDRETVMELAGRGLRGNELLLALKGRRERIKAAEDTISSGLLEEVEALLSERHGMTFRDACRLLAGECVRLGRLPFEPQTQEEYEAELAAAIEEAQRDVAEGRVYDNFEAMGVEADEARSGRA